IVVVIKMRKGAVTLSKEHWDESFSDTDYVYGEEPNVFIRQMSDWIPSSSRVGCFAEGEGRNAVYLAGKGHDVTSFDQSDIGLKKPRELADRYHVNVTTEEADLTADRVDDNQFDAVVMVFGH